MRADPRDVDTRSLRVPGWLDKPGALRSLEVCLDSRGPFIEVVKKSAPAMLPQCAFKNVCHEVGRCGTGGRPAAFQDAPNRRSPHAVPHVLQRALDPL
jgi:hypothetical protein